MTLPVAILAGGLATRLRPVTEKIPKALVRIAGRPFIDHQLALLKANGLSRVVLCVGHLGELIEQHVGDGSRVGLRINCVFDGPRLLGTGGALRNALSFLGEAFFVLYGDSYLPCRYRAVEEAFRASGAPGLMAVYRNDNRWDRSNVVYAEGRVLRYDKRAPSPDMQYIDYGLSALSAAALEDYPGGRAFDLAGVYAKLAAQGVLAGFEATERFYEIGTPEGIADAERYLSSNPPAGEGT